jgi:hypothetical protein
VLTSHTQAPVVTHASVGTDLLKPFKIITQFTVQTAGNELWTEMNSNLVLYYASIRQ